MKNLVIFISMVLTLISCSPRLIAPTDRVDIDIYLKPDDFINNKIFSKRIYTKIIETNADYILVGGIFEHETQRSNRELNRTFVISHNNEKYLNLFYINTIQNPLYKNRY